MYKVLGQTKETHETKEFQNSFNLTILLRSVVNVKKFKPTYFHSLNTTILVSSSFSCGN